jgi:hypothetical protein
MPMSDFFHGGGPFGSFDLTWMGAVSPAIVKLIYPMDAIAQWHHQMHIPGVTSHWMDAARGSFHRLLYGHHLVEDGFRILTSPDLSFGEFLHHLGLDFLTTRGIPNPVIPSSVIHGLIEIGLPKSVVNELVTVNLPKVLGGSLCFLTSGRNVLLAFSDAIPHTYSAALQHLGLGALEIALSVFPPWNINVFAAVAGLAEFGVGLVTLSRAYFDPVVPMINAPLSVFLPAISSSVGLGALLGTCIAICEGQGFGTVIKRALTGAISAGVYRTVAFMAGTTILGPILGTLAAWASFWIIRQLLPEQTSETYNDISYTTFEEICPNYFEHKSPYPNYFGDMLIPFFAVGKAPFGYLEGNVFELAPPEGDVVI